MYGYSYLLSAGNDNIPGVGEIREFSIFAFDGEIGPGKSGDEVLVSATLSPETAIHLRNKNVGD